MVFNANLYSCSSPSGYISLFLSRIVGDVIYPSVCPIGAGIKPNSICWTNTSGYPISEFDYLPVIDTCESIRVCSSVLEGRLRVRIVSALCMQGKRSNYCIKKCNMKVWRVRRFKTTNEPIFTQGEKVSVPISCRTSWFRRTTTLVPPLRTSVVTASHL